MSVGNQKRLRYPLGVVALVVGIVLLQGVLEILVRRAIADGFPAWLPTVGTTGQTVTAYVLAGNVYTYLLVPAAAFWLGARYARAAA